MVVELMRQGKSPQQACEEAILRITEKQKDHRKFQVGFIACNLNGEVGAYSLQKGFQYALQQKDNAELIDSAFLL